MREFNCAFKSSERERESGWVKQNAIFNIGFEKVMIRIHGRLLVRLWPRPKVPGSNPKHIFTLAKRLMGVRQSHKKLGADTYYM